MTIRAAAIPDVAVAGLRYHKVTPPPKRISNPRGRRCDLGCPNRGPE